MDLRTMALTRTLDHEGLLLKQLAEQVGLMEEAQAVFSLPFREEPLEVDGAKFEPSALADLEREIVATFQSPPLLLFLNNLKKLRVLRVDADGTVSTRFMCSVESKEMRAVKRNAMAALRTKTDMPCTPPVANVVMHRCCDDDESATASSEWWYTARIAADGTSMLQLARSVGLDDDVDAGFVLSVGLPFSSCPLLCHASASLQLNDGRVSVLYSSLNSELLDALASMYCSGFLRKVDPYQKHWPLRDYLPEGKLQYLVKCVLLALDKWDTGFPLLDCAPGAIPSSGGGGGARAAAAGGAGVQTPLRALCACPDGAPVNIIRSYQQLMLHGKAPHGQPYLVTSLGKEAIAAFRKVLPWTLPEWNAALCVENLRLVLKDYSASCWDVISNDQRRDLLRYILDNTEVEKRKDALLGLPLCERRVSAEESQWAQFPTTGGPAVFLNDPSAVALLLDVTDNDAVVLSDASTHIFRLLPAASLVTYLSPSHLIAGNAALLRRQLQHLDAVHATEQQRRAFVVSFWALMAKSHEGRILTADEEAPLLSLPLLWRWNSGLDTTSDAKGVVLRLPRLDPPIHDRPRGVCCNALPTCLLVAKDDNGRTESRSTLLLLLEALGVPLLDPEIAAGVMTLPGASGVAASLLHLIELLVVKLPSTPPQLICERILKCLTSAELLDELRAAGDHGLKLRKAVQRLPVFTVLGSGEHSPILDGTTGKLSGIVVDSDVFATLPSSVRMRTVMFSIPQQLSTALRLTPAPAKCVAAEQLAKPVCV